MKARSNLAAPLLARSLAATTAVWAHPAAESSHSDGKSGKPPEQLGRVSFDNSVPMAPAPHAPTCRETPAIWPLQW